MIKKCEKKPLISVIIPVYNGEKELEHCIKSVLMQTYEDLEIILIDDGSTDSSGKLCDEFKLLDERVKVCHTGNKGLSCARNCAIDMAKGEFLTFVDADDAISPYYCECLYDTIKKTEADIAVCRYKCVYSMMQMDENDNKCESEKLLSKREAMEHLILNENTNYVWGKLYVNRLFQNTRFIPNRTWEDIAIMYQLYEQCGSIVYLDKTLYYYYVHSNTISDQTKMTVKKKIDLCLSWMEQYEFCLENYPYLSVRCLTKTLSRYSEIFNESLKKNENNAEYIKTRLGEHYRDILFSAHNPIRIKLYFLYLFLYKSNLHKIL